MTITHWEFIAECLREELADYGGLLFLFEQQQQCIFDRDAESVLRLSGEIEQQARTLSECRERREHAVAAFAELHGCDPRSSLRSLLSHIEPAAQPLILALINEVNALLHRLRRVNRHNHSLLARAVDTHRDVLERLRPQTFTKTYSPAGRVALAAAARPPSTLRAIG